jgi:hypothetical protein
VFVPIDKDNYIRHLDLIPSLEKARNSLRMKRTSKIRLLRDTTRIVEQDVQYFANRFDNDVVDSSGDSCTSSRYNREEEVDVEGRRNLKYSGISGTEMMGVFL